MYALAGDHDFYTSEEWEDIFGYGREFEVDIDDYRFIAVDVYRNTIGQMVDGHTVASVLDESDVTARVNNAINDGKQAIIMCHYDNGIIGNNNTTSTWRNFVRSNVTAVFRAHTHTPAVDNNSYGDLIYYNDGNFSYPPDANWNNMIDADGNPTRRWGFRVFEKIGDTYKSYEVYPSQTLEINNDTKIFDYEIGKIDDVRVL